MAQPTAEHDEGCVIHGGPFSPEWEARIPSSLSEALDRVIREGDPRLSTVDQEGQSADETYGELRTRAMILLARFRAAALRPGDRLLLQVRQPRDFLAALWACVLGDLIPAPFIVPPAYRGQDVACRRLTAAWELLDRPTVVVDELVGGELEALIAERDLPQLSLLSIAADDRRFAPERYSARRGGDDTALVLLTSGSSGGPKGVPLSHRNLGSMAIGTGQQNGWGHASVTLNWLPLDHVGAVSFLHLMPTILGLRQIHVASDYVLADLLRWIDLLDEHRATISWAPNFAFRLLSQRTDEARHRDWDLSHIEFLVNAGEAVVPQTALDFFDLFRSYGLSLSAIRPAFGMSETCSGITWSRGLEREQLASRDGYVDLGPPIPGASLRVVDENDQPLPEGLEGRLQLRGPSVFRGYLNRPDLTQQAFTVDGWFDSGDLGRLDGGRLVITGRAKEVIIINGVHYSGQQIEAAVDALDGVRTSYTAATAVRPPGSDTDRLAVFFAAENEGATDKEVVAGEVRRAVVHSVGLSPDYVICVPKAEVPKTGIGKIQRAKLRQLFEDGSLRPIELAPASTSPAHRSATGTEAADDVLDRLCRIWRTVLDNESVSADDVFFEVGGQSIDLPRLANQVHETFGVDVSPADVLAYPTPLAMAGWIIERVGSQSRSDSVSKLRVRALRPSTDPGAATNGIAIVGMACRFPGAANVEEFWRNLCEGRETIQRLSADELRAGGVPQEVIDDPHYVPAAPWLEGIDQFDASFFGYDDEQARWIDPQQRLFLECAWHALEDAGTDPARFDGRVGVFGSAGLNTYMSRFGIEPQLTGDFQQALTAGAVDFMATRVSYKLNLTGPSVSVQTACSSGLYAVHLACQSLMAGECEMALAGGASLWLLERQGYWYRPGGLASSDGRCRSFDAAGTGMVFGNGVGLVVLKPLADAVRDGDTVHAVIRGSAVNNDGAMKAGFIATGMQGQAEVVEEAYRRAQVGPETVGMIECHGTGTVLGDAVEVGALTKAFCPATSKTGYCAIGSVKTNIGHMGVACGIAGLIKATLAVEHGLQPPSLNCNELNPQIDFASSPFFVNTELHEWPVELSPRRAGVTSLGLGGANVHVVLEQPPVTMRPSSEPRGELLLLSAKTESALENAAMALASHLDEHADLALEDVARTLAVGRRQWDVRRFVVASDTKQAARRFKEPFSAPTLSGRRTRRAALCLPDPDDVRMTDLQALCAGLPVFRDAVNEIIEQLGAVTTGDSAGELLKSAAGGGQTPPPLPELTSQASAVLNGAAQYGVARVWQSWLSDEPLIVGFDGGLPPAQVLTGTLDTRAWLEQLLSDSPQQAGEAKRGNETLAKRHSPKSSDAGVSAGLSGAIGEWQESDGKRPGHLPVVIGRVGGEDIDGGTTRYGGPIVLAGPEVDGSPWSREALFDMVGRCWLMGIEFRWERLYDGKTSKKVALPTYPFERRRYWMDAPHAAQPLPRNRVDSTSTPNQTQTPAADEARSTAPISASRRPRGWMRAELQGLSEKDRSAHLSDWIDDQVMDLVGAASVNTSATDVGFIDLGLTSTTVLELIERLSRALDRQLAQTIVMEYPHPRLLAAHLARTVDESVAADLHTLQENPVEARDVKSESVARPQDAGWVWRPQPGNVLDSPLASDSRKTRVIYHSGHPITDRLAEYSDVEGHRAIVVDVRRERDASLDNTRQHGATDAVTTVMETEPGRETIDLVGLMPGWPSEQDVVDAIAKAARQFSRERGAFVRVFFVTFGSAGRVGAGQGAEAGDSVANPCDQIDARDFPGIAIHWIDLDRDPKTDDLDLLLDELATPTPPSRIAYRGGLRFVGESENGTG